MQMGAALPMLGFDRSTLARILIGVCALQVVECFLLPSTLPAVSQCGRSGREGVLALSAKKGPTVRPYFEGMGKQVRRRKVGGISKAEQEEQARKKAFEAVREASAAQLDAVKNGIHLIRKNMRPALEKDGFFVCDNFLGRLSATQMLAEAKALQSR